MARKHDLLRHAIVLTEEPAEFMFCDILLLGDSGKEEFAAREAVEGSSGVVWLAILKIQQFHIK